MCTQYKWRGNHAGRFKASEEAEQSFDPEAKPRKWASKRKNKNQEIRAIKQRLAHRRVERNALARREGPLGLSIQRWLDDLDKDIDKMEARLSGLDI